jgi:hypothetical protein
MYSTGQSFYLFHSIDSRPFSLSQFPIMGRNYAVGTPPHFDNAPFPHPTSQLLANYSRSQNSEPEYCLVSEGRNPIRNNPQVLEISTLWGPLIQGTTRAAGSAGTLYAPLLLFNGHREVVPVRETVRAPKHLPLLIRVRIGGNAST